MAQCKCDNFVYICDVATQNYTDSKGYLVDEDGFDYMKISFLKDIKAQQRSLRFVI